MKGSVINWGILGPGKIAHKFASDLVVDDGSRLISVGSRSRDKAEEFKRQYGLKNAYGSYEELAGCPDVDVIYVATPHAFHKDHTILCLKNGKHVLCEKPLALNSSEVKEMIQVARTHHVFLMEAIWTRFFPFMHKLHEIIKKGELGDLKMLEADFGFYKPFDAESRVFNPHLGGGALMDIGIYPVFLAMTLFGRPDTIDSKAFLAESGVDLSTSIRLTWDDGKMANLHCALNSLTSTTAMISGTERYIEVPSRWHESKKMHLWDKNGMIKTYAFPDEFIGYKYEIEEVNRCLQANLIESPVLPLSFSLDLMNVLDKIRGQIGVRYPFE